MNTSFICGMFDDFSLTTGGTVGMVVILVVMVLAAAAVNIVPRLVHKWEIEYRTRDLTYGAVCLAMAYALSWARMFSMPLGGSVTPAALAPLFIYCYYFGFRKGAVISCAYMLLQFTQGAYVVSPWSAFFDYVLPCMSLCIVGLFGYKPARYASFVKRGAAVPNGAKSSVKYWAYTVGGHWGAFAGVGIQTVVRYASLVTSGVISWDYFGYDPASLSYKLTFSLSYNSFALVDSLIALVAVVMLLSSRAFNVYMSASFADKRVLAAARSGGEEVAEQPAGAADGVPVAADAEAQTGEQGETEPAHGDTDDAVKDGETSAAEQ